MESTTTPTTGAPLTRRRHVDLVRTAGGTCRA
ncbi:putative leader peptide [Kineococcus sp. SYSU DK004]